MPRTITQIIAELPAARQASIETRYRALKRQVGVRGQHRETLGKAKADVAAAPKTKSK